jgi:hypothetical protein
MIVHLQALGRQVCVRMSVDECVSECAHMCVKEPACAKGVCTMGDCGKEIFVCLGSTMFQ